MSFSISNDLHEIIYVSLNLQALVQRVHSPPDFYLSQTLHRLQIIIIITFKFRNQLQTMTARAKNVQLSLLPVSTRADSKRRSLLLFVTSIVTISGGLFSFATKSCRK